jgi:hypothetical protein
MGRDKQKRKAKKQNQRTREVFTTVSGGDPPILGEPDIPVRAPLKPEPHIRSGAIAVPEPEPEDAFLTVNPKIITR